MDQQAKREKEREKKRRQREKLKLNQEKYQDIKSKDAARKKQERQQLKENAALHPRKYKYVLNKIRENTASRVKKCREKKRLIQEEVSPKTPNAQKLRRKREREKGRIQELRFQEKERRAANKERVTNFRMRVKLRNHKPETQRTPKTSLQCYGYRHQSSEYRAYKRLESALPSTPAKKVRLMEKLMENTTPRSRRALSQSPTVQSTLNPQKSKKRLSAQFAMTESIRYNLSNRKGKRSSTSLAAMKLVGKARKVSAVSALLGVSRKKLARSIKKENVVRKQRCDRIDSNKLECIQNFYLEEASREMPNKRDMLLLKDDSGKKFPVQKQIMEMTQTEAYDAFKSKNPDVKIGQRRFDTLRPKQVRQTNISNRIVCCCTYCENVRLKVQTLNKVVKHDATKSTRSVVDLTMCARIGTYHQNECIHRQCDKCGTNFLNQMFIEELQSDGDKLVTWRAWEKKRVPLDDERFVSRVVLTEHKSTFSEFFNDLTSALAIHTEHLFRASWQYDQFRENVQNIQEGEVVMAMDFSENYTCRYGREIQSVHWNQKQITVHPMMLYYKEDGELKKEGFTCITDDLKHDFHAVSEFEQAAVKHLKDKNIPVNVINQWTDGCASQYKCRHSFSAISSAENLLNAKVTRNYFETSHGKGPCDGLGGIVKRKVSNAIVKDNNLVISNAEEMTEFCNENLKSVGESYSKARMNKYAASSRSFKYIETIDRSKVTSAKTLSGSRKLHSVRSTGINHQLEVRVLSCYCDGCRKNNECINTDYVQPWKKHVLKSTDENAANENDSAVTETQRHTGTPNVEIGERPVQVSPGEPSLQNRNENGVPSPNDFVAIKFESKSSKVCFFAKICEVEQTDIKVEFLEKTGRNYQYPEVADESWQSLPDIICILNAPNVVVTGSRVKCAFALNEHQKELLKSYKLM